MKRPLEVTVAGWLRILLGLIISLLSIDTPSFQRAMAISPFPEPLPQVLLFGGAIISTACGIGMLYGENLARLGPFAWEIMSLCSMVIVGLTPS